MTGNCLCPVVSSVVWLMIIFVCESETSDEAKHGFIDTPSNVASIVNSTVSINCATNEPVGWFLLNMDGSTNKTIWQNGRLNKKIKFKGFSVLNKPEIGQSYLVIKQLEIEDAGLYRCLQLNSSQSYTSQLIVLVSDPVCSSNTTHVWCHIYYDGNGWSPRMRWFQQQPNGYLKISDTLVTYTNTSNSITSAVQLKSINSSVVQCMTYFLFTPSVKIQAMNIPSYTFNWTFNITRTNIKTESTTERGESNTKVTVDKSFHKPITMVYEHLANLTSQQDAHSKKRQTRPVVLNDEFLSSLQATFSKVAEETLYAVAYSFSKLSTAHNKDNLHCSEAYCKKLIFSPYCKSGGFNLP